MDIIQSLIARVEEYRSTNKNPCRNYATQKLAQRNAEEAARIIAAYYDKEKTPVRYVVFFVPSWGRWTAAFDFTELFKRSTFQGGYVGHNHSFFTY